MKVTREMMIEATEPYRNGGLATGVSTGKVYEMPPIPISNFDYLPSEFDAEPNANAELTAPQTELPSTRRQTGAVSSSNLFGGFSGRKVRESLSLRTLADHFVKGYKMSEESEKMVREFAASIKMGYAPYEKGKIKAFAKMVIS